MNYHDIPPRSPRPLGQVEDIGFVPSGPHTRIATTSSAERVVYLPSGSTAVIPKDEDHEIDLSILPSVENEQAFTQDAEEGEVREVGPAQVEDQDPADLTEDYQNYFARMLAEYANNGRRSPSGSKRQETWYTPCRARQNSWSSRARNRSLSPRFRRESTRSGSNRSSPMFFPERPRAPSRSSRDSGPGGSLPSNRDPSSSTEPWGGSQSNDDSDLRVRCHCLISYDCEHRAVHLLDCRPLVREWTSWSDRADQEAWDVHQKARARNDNRCTTAQLVRITTLIDNFKNALNAHRRQRAHRNMRNWIMEMEDVTLSPGEQQDAARQEVVPKLTEFLSSENAQMRHIGRLPMYIEEELNVLRIKWGRGDFDGSIHRGLREVRTFDVNGTPRRTTRQPDPFWPHYKSALYFGNGDLVNGQIFMSRAELMRDGVHAPPIAGISGTTKEGAYSIVLGEFDEKKSVGYADIDMGDVIEYMGTALKDEENNPPAPTNIRDPHMDHDRSANLQAARTPTVATRVMMKSLDTGNPVRVIRSWKMCDIVRNKPGKGYRYDGLYKVVSMVLMKEARQIWSFRLERLRDQGPLRGFGQNEPHPPSNGQRLGHSRTRNPR